MGAAPTHNLRKALVTYTIDDHRRNISDRSYEEAIDLFHRLLEEAVSNYYNRTQQKIQTDEKKYIWEAVVNVNKHHNIKDIQALAKALGKKYGWQAIHCSIHADEGHIEKKSGEKIYNYHAHIVLFMLDADGIYRFKKGQFGVKKMEELQTFVANSLGMERGLSKKKTKKIRLEHRAYRQQMQIIEMLQYKYNLLQGQFDDVSGELRELSDNKEKTNIRLKEEQDKNKEIQQKYNSIMSSSQNMTDGYEQVFKQYKLFLRQLTVILELEIKANNMTDFQNIIIGNLEKSKNDMTRLNNERDNLEDALNMTKNKFNELQNEHVVTSDKYKDLFENSHDKIAKLTLKTESLKRERDDLENEVYASRDKLDEVTNQHTIVTHKYKDLYENSQEKINSLLFKVESLQDKIPVEEELESRVTKPTKKRRNNRMKM